MDYHIVETATCGQLLGRNQVVSHNSTSLSYARSGSAGDASTLAIAWEILSQEFLQQIYLLSQFKISLKDMVNTGHINTVHLCSIYLTFTISYRRMKTHSGQFLRQFTLIGASLAEVEETLLAQTHIIHIADADNALLLVYTRNGKLQGYRLHQAVITSLLGRRTRQKCHQAVARSIDNDLTQQCNLTLVCRQHNALHGIALLHDIAYRTLQIDLDIRMRNKLCQHSLRSLKVMRTSGATNHIVLRHFKQAHQLISHRTLGNHTENWAYISHCEIASHNTVALHKSHLRTFTCRSHRCTYARRSRTCNNHIIGTSHLDLLTIIYFHLALHQYIYILHTKLQFLP